MKDEGESAICLLPIPILSIELNPTGCRGVGVSLPEAQKFFALPLDSGIVMG
ncbi:hypothetical protein VB712_13260 [Spirulina sp. CCNP1310]|uniref:hypothetical protein n=1 Tax=Spirulina sp. CCNP1310 TaxID=3110249 RepID=UPI002B1F886A|nr:hypothetical protein [Spirulina sp. CCNP1310]MEA5420193.1 hypothetical protein [Spirulina sp. CCNP1310]